jgi:hypothetical protein
LVLLLVGIAATLVVWRWSRNRARWEDDGLDERDRRERDRSWAVSYRILALAVVIAPGTVAILSLAGADIAADHDRRSLCERCSVEADDAIRSVNREAISAAVAPF